jgi:IMP dehydrogenase
MDAKMKELFTFDDVLIVPKFSIVESRKDVDISFHGLNIDLEIPVMLANMDSLVGTDSATAMAASGAIACLHRFQTIEQNVNEYRKVYYENNSNVICSIGTGVKELERAEALFDAGCCTMVLDLAHSASIGAVKQVKALRELLGYNDLTLIVGNFATGDSVLHFLEHLNNESIQGVKVGIGGGSRCSTRTVTGCGYPQLSAIMDVSSALKDTDIKIIADGGMNKTGDICKSLAAGAHIVMSGKFFAGCLETPGETVNSLGQPTEVWKHELANGSLFKKYRGSASRDSYADQGKLADHRTPEGESTLVPYKGPIKNILQEINGGIRSSLSYVGATNLEEYHQRAEFVRITPNAVIENGTRN